MEKTQWKNVKSINLNFFSFIFSFGLNLMASVANVSMEELLGLQFT